MKKKLLALVLCIALVASLCVGIVACNKKDDFKVGLICLHGESSTYDKNFIDAMKEVQTKLGLKDSQVIIKTDIDESSECYDAAADLVDQGCDIIFADSFGHEDFMLQAAKEFPEVQFCHATGTQAHTANVANFQNAFAAIYEGRYLAGIAAGMKLKALYGDDITTDEAKMGYIGAHPYAEVVSGYTSFYLGAKSVCPNVTMDVKYTGSWFDEAKEKETAEYFIANGCKLISQHADSWGAPKACEQAGIPNVAYNGSTASQCPNTGIVSSRINWAPYYEYAIKCAQEGTDIAADWTGTIATGSVVMTAVNTQAAAEGTQAAIDAAIAQFKAGTLKVFDVTKDNYITVEGAKITSYNADVDDLKGADGKSTLEKDKQVIIDGAFAESAAGMRSAPYFDIRIDGITEIS